MKARRQPDERDRELGAELRRLREARRLTQTHVAERIDLTPQQYSKYERGLSRMTKTLHQRLMEILAPETAPQFSEQRQATFDITPPGIKALMSDSIARVKAELDNLNSIVARL